MFQNYRRLLHDLTKLFWSWNFEWIPRWLGQEFCWNSCFGRAKICKRDAMLDQCLPGSWSCCGVRRISCHAFRVRAIQRVCTLGSLKPASRRLWISLLHHFASSCWLIGRSVIAIILLILQQRHLRIFLANACQKLWASRQSFEFQFLNQGLTKGFEWFPCSENSHFCYHSYHLVIASAQWTSSEMFHNL